MWIDATAALYEITDADVDGLRSTDPEERRGARTAIQQRVEKRNGKQLARDYVRAIETIVAAYPDDIEAKALLVNQIWLGWRDFEIAYNSYAAPDALLDQVFAAAPLHPAHHYRIHLWDHEKPERALRSAAVIGHTAPAIAHQWHMGEHIFDKLKRFEDATWQQLASSCADHAHMQRDRVLPYAIHNYGHNQEWLIRNLGKLGRVHEAVALAQNMISLPRHPARNALGKPRSIAAYGQARLLDVLADHEMWEALLSCAEQGFLENADEPAARGRRAAMLAIAHAELGHREAVAAQLTELTAATTAARTARAQEIDRAEAAALERSEADERVREAMGKALEDGTKPVRRLESWRAQVELVQLLATDELPAARERLTQAKDLPADLRVRAWLRLGEPAKAVEVAQQDVEKHPRSTPELARLVLALHAAGRADQAREKFTELRTVAGHADLDAPLLQRLVALAEAFGFPADWRTPEPPRDDVGDRPPLAEIGPLLWTPQPAPDFTLPVVSEAGGSQSLAGLRGEPVLLVAYLGFGCLHCVEQLQALQPRQQEFAALGIRVVAVGTDPVDSARASLATFAPGERPTFPLLADPELTLFRDYHAYDDFERMPLHGTFLLDAQGRIRWQDISAEPFTDFAFLLGEAKRLLQLGSGG
jgi:peroxiredoxin